MTLGSPAFRLLALIAASTGGAASAQPAMDEAEARLLYAAGGFPISEDGESPLDRCGAHADPRITFIDINSDGRRDALFTDAGDCYGAERRWFAMAVKEADRSWRGVGGFAGAAPAGPSPASQEEAIFRAAGFTRRGGAWESGNCEAPHEASYSPGSIERIEDINGDGRPDAVVMEGGAMCYGMTGANSWLLSQQADGGWKVMLSGIALFGFLDSRGVDGWPDISLGGPGFCFPVVRWNGREYARIGSAYEGKPCNPPY